MTAYTTLFCTDEVLADTDSPVQVHCDAQKYGRNYLFMSDATKRLIDMETDEAAALDEEITAAAAEAMQNATTPLDASESAVCTPTLMKRASTPPAPLRQKNSAAAARARHERSCAWDLESEFAPVELRVNRTLNF